MKLLKRIRHSWRLRKMEAELTEEIDLHRQMSDDRAMGDMDRAFADSREVWQGSWQRRWWRGVCRLRHAPRRLMRRLWRPQTLAKSIFEITESCLFVWLLFGWQWLTGTALTTRTACVLGGFYLLSSVVNGIRSVERRYQDIKRARRERPERVFVEDPGAVLEIAKLSGYDASRPFNRYRGKWMTVSGEFEGIAESLEGDTIHLSLRIEDGRLLNLQFPTKLRHELERIRPGQRLHAAGQIEQERFELVLPNCELQRVEPLRAKNGLVLAS